MCTCAHYRHGINGNNFQTNDVNSDITSLVTTLTAATVRGEFD